MAYGLPRRHSRCHRRRQRQCPADLDNEPQPDALLIIGPERGGQARVSEDDYIEGAPELVAEVAASSVSIDLHKKLHVYRRSGVREYVVWRVEDRRIDWYALRDGEFIRREPDEKGHYRSQTFPGLWLDATALVEGDMAKVLDVVRQGLAAPEHAKFVSDLSGRSVRLGACREFRPAPPAPPAEPGRRCRSSMRAPVLFGLCLAVNDKPEVQAKVFSFQF